MDMTGGSERAPSMDRDSGCRAGWSMGGENASALARYIGLSWYETNEEATCALPSIDMDGMVIGADVDAKEAKSSSTNQLEI